MKKHYILSIVTFFIIITAQAQLTKKSNNKGKPLYIENNECYCFYDFSYAQFLNQYYSLLDAERELWLNEQEEILLEEIEDRLNDNFNNFQDAREAFFEDFAGLDIQEQYIDDFRSINYQNRLEFDFERKQRYSKFMVFNNRENDLNRISNGLQPLYDYGQITYGNERLIDKPYSFINSVLSHATTQFNDSNNLYEQTLYEVIAINSIEDANTFSNYIVNLYIDDYNNITDLYIKIDLMTRYLIYHFSGDKGPIQVPAAFFNPYIYDIEAIFRNFIDDVNVNYPAPSIPQLSWEEAKINFVVDEMTEQATDFINESPELKEPLGDYFEGNNYDTPSLIKMEALIDRALNGQYLTFPDHHLNSSNVSFQSEDRPYRIINVGLPNDGIGRGLYGISDVLAILSDLDINPWVEGHLIHQFLDANGIDLLANELFNYRDLDTLFDFTTADAGYVKIIFSDYARDHILSPYHGDDLYGTTIFTDTFKLQGLRAIVDGGYVDFDEQIVYNLPPCIGDIIEQLKDSQNGLFSRVMNKFKGNNPIPINYNWMIEQDTNCSGISFAYTEPTIQNNGFAITSVCTNNTTNSSNIGLASTIIHEGFHAYLVALYRFRDIDKEYISLISEFANEYNNNPNDIHHAVFIKSDIINEIAIALEEFGNFQGYNLTGEFYQDIAWSGLTHIRNPLNPEELIINPSFIDAVPNLNSRVRILDRISAEKFNTTTNGYEQQGENMCN